MRAAFVLVLLSACWRGTSSPPPAAPEEPQHATMSARPSAPGCTRVGDNVEEILREGEDQSLVTRADGIRAAIVHHCDADAWSAELRECLGGAGSLQDANECEQLATPEQRDALYEDLDKIEVGN